MTLIYINCSYSIVWIKSILHYQQMIAAPIGSIVWLMKEKEF